MNIEYKSTYTTKHKLLPKWTLRELSQTKMGAIGKNKPYYTRLKNMIKKSKNVHQKVSKKTYL